MKTACLCLRTVHFEPCRVKYPFADSDVLTAAAIVWPSVLESYGQGKQRAR
jgi:hypothetical protein